MIVFHHNDADGRCAAAIVKSWHDIKQRFWAGVGFSGIRMVEMDYKDTVSIDLINPKDTVVIVDFSFKPDDMQAVMAKTEMGVVWCDHHETAEAYGYDVPGLRDFTAKGLCGAELTWKFFFPDNPIPYWLMLLGDYDAWRMQHKEECLPFYEGLKLWNQSPLGEDNVWICLFKEKHVWKKIIEEGKTAVKYRDMYCGELRSTFGFETKIGGQNAYALNAYRFGSQGFGNLVKEYPVCIAFIYDGKQFTVSLYSETVDVSAIAKSFGGGGHKGAAGFICSVLPFSKLS